MITNSVLIFLTSTLMCFSYSATYALFSESSTNKSADSNTPLEDNLQYNLENIQRRALDWLQTKRTEDYGWPSGDTARAVVALASRVKDWPAKNDIEARLIVKQLEIELLDKLLRKDTIPITPVEVCYYALAIVASNRDPHNFHGHNLIVSLEKHHEDVDYPGYPTAFGYAFTSLVSCISGTHIHKHQARHLLQIARDDSTSTKMYSLDTRATAVIALECIRNRKTSDFLSRHILEPLHEISKLQLEDGTFGNLHSTALAIQALSGIQGAEINWNKSGAVHALEVLQESNGSFLNSVRATVDAVIATSALLNGIGILGVNKDHYKSSRHKNKHRNGSMSSSSSLSPSSLADEDMSMMYNNVQSNHGDQDITLPSTTKLNEIRPITEVERERSGAKKDNQSPSFVHLDSSDETRVGGNGLQNEYLNKNSSNHADIDSNAIGGSRISSSDEESLKKEKFERNVDNSKNPKHDVNVTYWLWIGPEPASAEKYNMTVKIEGNATFYAVMQKAASLNHKFVFESTVWPNGHYVHTISNHKEEPVMYHYWLLYRLNSDPNPLNPPSNSFVAPAGVDDLRVADGQVYLFWFKKI